MIKSFSCKITEKLFNGEALRRKEINELGSCDLERVIIVLTRLNQMNEHDLITAISYHYHKIQGGNFYSIDTKRNSKWRILFQWDNEELTDVKLVRLTTETHR